ncbi:hypothetical protein evm_010722 [Chilo suppressalis]|nr:hypothetical protein evm_010722 [Chilo suppressalis]
MAIATAYDFILQVRRLPLSSIALCDHDHRCNLVKGFRRKDTVGAQYGWHYVWIREIGPAMTHDAGPGWLLTTADAARTNSLMCLLKHGGARDSSSGLFYVCSTSFQSFI